MVNESYKFPMETVQQRESRHYGFALCIQTKLNDVSRKNATQKYALLTSLLYTSNGNSTITVNNQQEKTWCTIDECMEYTDWLAARFEDDHDTLALPLIQLFKGVIQSGFSALPYHAPLVSSLQQQQAWRADISTQLKPYPTDNPTKQQKLNFINATNQAIKKYEDGLLTNTTGINIDDLASLVHHLKEEMNNNKETSDIHPAARTAATKSKSK